MTQLDLGLAEPPCQCCAGEREIDPPFPGMDIEPCPLCCERAWWQWSGDPYGLRLEPSEPRRPSWDRRPAARGQLGLSIGNRREPAKVTRA